MSTDNNTEAAPADTTLMDPASPRFGEYVESLRPANHEPSNLAPPGPDDRGWLVYVDVQSGEWRVASFMEYMGLEMRAAGDVALTANPRPTAVAYAVDAANPSFRGMCYAIAAALQGVVAPGVTPWPPGTREEILDRMNGEVRKWAAWLAAHYEHTEARAAKAEQQRIYAEFRAKVGAWGMAS